jgi:hypothetical protein
MIGIMFDRCPKCFGQILPQGCSCGLNKPSAIETKNEETMDKKIKKLESTEKKLLKGTKSLLKEDKARDKQCDMGAKMMKKKKK